MHWAITDTAVMNMAFPFDNERR